MKRISLYALLAPALLLLAACSSVDGPSPAGTPAILEPDGSPVPLYAGQDLQVGQVLASDDGATLTVTYRTDPGWCLLETHLGLGKSVDDLLGRTALARGGHGKGKGHDIGRGKGHDIGRGKGHDKHHDDDWGDGYDDPDEWDDDHDDGSKDDHHDVANPNPGSFPYGNEHDCVSEYTYTIDFDEFGFDAEDLQDDHGYGKKIVVAAHALVKGGETHGASDGVDAGECRFAMYGVDVAEESGTQRTFYAIDDVPGQVFEPLATFDVGEAVEADYDYAIDALAYDAVGERLYFAERGVEASTLHGYDLAGGAFFVAGELGGLARGATFHDGGYYYVPDRSSELRRVEFAADGTIASETTVEAFVPNEPLEVVDLAIRDGVLYGSTTGTVEGSVGQFFSFDLASGTFVVHQTYGEGAFHQLAFAEDGTLYGTLTLDTVFSEIDVTNGTIQNLDFWPQVAFADLASGAACDVAQEPETPAGEERTETAWAGTKPFPNAHDGSRYFVYVLDWVEDGDDGKTYDDEDHVDHDHDDEKHDDGYGEEPYDDGHDGKDEDDDRDHEDDDDHHDEDEDDDDDDDDRDDLDDDEDD